MHGCAGARAEVSLPHLPTKALPLIYSQQAHQDVARRRRQGASPLELCFRHRCEARGQNQDPKGA